MNIVPRQAVTSVTITLTPDEVSALADFFECLPAEALPNGGSIAAELWGRLSMIDQGRI